MSRKVLLLLLLVAGTVFMAGCVVMPFEPRHWDFPSYIFPFFLFPFGLLGIALYFLPTIIAAVRHKKDIVGIVPGEHLPGLDLYRVDSSPYLGSCG